MAMSLGFHIIFAMVGIGMPMLMVIVDRQVAMVPLDPDDGRRGALVLTGAGVLAALCAVFDQFWRAATPWEQDLRRDESGLSAQERELLWLLGQGLTDEVAARRLGVSLRTVRRTASDLMAGSRRAAGFRTPAPRRHLRRWTSGAHRLRSDCGQAR